MHCKKEEGVKRSFSSARGQSPQKLIITTYAEAGEAAASGVGKKVLNNKYARQNLVYLGYDGLYFYRDLFSKSFAAVI
ncbi:MAG: hypothetical protein HDT46_08435 [Ruminococcaceae bacterium]|nr:hypothetical protein [Oscillospiraceae bacterium]